MSVVRYQLGETVYFSFGGKVVKASIVSCNISMENTIYSVEYVVNTLTDKGILTLDECQLFSTALEVVENLKNTLRYKISLYEGLKEEAIDDLTELQKEYGC
jgi:hypothetical protein